MTGLIVLLIIGGAIVLSRGRTAQPPSVAEETAPPQPYAMQEQQDRPSAHAVVAMGKAPGVSGGRDLGIDKWGRPVLLLDHLAGTLKASVPALTEREKRLPLEHTCFRAHISPPVRWSGSPRETQSFVVFVERRGGDKEAPYLTWALYNIPATYTSIAQNLPKLLEPGEGMRHARSDADATEYVGPCESKGRIPYVLRVFALDAALALPAGAPNHDLMRAMNGHIIDMAEVDFIHYLRF